MGGSPYGIGQGVVPSTRCRPMAAALWFVLSPSRELHMAKPLTFRLGDNPISFDVGAKVDKKALYGFARRIAEKDGKALSRGVLLADGRLLPSSALSPVKADPEGSPIEEARTLIDDQPAELKPSSFDVESPLVPAAIADLATFQVHDVYPLFGGSLPAGLYRTTFNYRKSHTPRDALLLVRGDQSFLLVGQGKRSTFLSLSVAYDFFDAEGEADDADDLDFSMV
jgi:hypothetical protein